MEHTTSNNNPNTVSANAVGETAPQPDPRRLTLALERHRAEFQAIPPEQLLTISIDVAVAAMSVLKRGPSWAPLLPRIQALPEVNYARILSLEGYAEATLKVNAEYITSAAPPPALAETLTEADTLRDSLRADAEVLLRRELLPSTSLDEVKGLAGYRNTAVDLTALVTVLEKHWDAIQGKTAITRQDLDRASLLAQHIFRNATDRQVRAPHNVDVARLRQQAFTALFRAYEELRRCIAFLHPQPGELERLAPSFYQGRGGRPVESAEPSTPVVAGPTGNGDAQSANPAPVATGGTAVASNPNALPSKSPFSS